MKPVSLVPAKQEFRENPADSAGNSQTPSVLIPPETEDNSPWRMVRALREPNYRNYFFGQGISLIGTWMQTAALGWVAFSFTEQSRWPAWVTASQLLPSVVLGPLAGKFIDRLPKRRLIMTTQCLLAALGILLAIASWNDWVTPNRLVLWAITSGIVMGIDLPARLAYLVDLTGRESLPNAVALNSFQFNLARAIGPSLAAAVMLQWGAPACFALNALTYFAVLFALATNNAPGLPHPRPHHSDPASKVAIPAAVWGTILLAGLVSGLGWPVLSLSPGYASQILHQGPDAYAQLVGGIGIGALLACVLVAGEKSESQRPRRMNLALLSVGSGLLLLGLVNQFWLALVATPLIGLGMVGFLATAQTTVQMNAPISKRGLVLGVWTGVLSGALPLGNFLAGPMADAWGVDWVLRLMGGGILLALGLRLLVRGVYPYQSKSRQ